MGQSLGTDSSTFENFKRDLLKGAHNVSDIVTLRYDEFLDMVRELNKMLYHISDSKEKVLLFAVEGGSDDSIFWKGTVRIGCFKPFPPPGLCKLLSLKQFIEARKMILQHIMPIFESQISNDQNSQAGACAAIPNSFSASTFLKEISDGSISTDLVECCICMERKPEVTLPCAHSYCLPCIEQWNVSNKTCPVCREKLENTNETWILPEIPELEEASAELHKALSQITSKLLNES